MTTTTDETRTLKIPEVKVTHIWQRCPNCSGYGAYGNPPNRVTCISCKGRGVILVPVEEKK